MVKLIFYYLWLFLTSMLVVISKPCYGQDAASLKKLSETETTATTNPEVSNDSSNESSEKEQKPTNPIIDPMNWFSSLASNKWRKSKGIITNVYITTDSEKDSIKKTYSELHSSNLGKSSFLFSNTYDAEFQKRINSKTPSVDEAENKGQKATEAKKIFDPFQGSIPIDIAINASENNRKATVTTKNAQSISWKFPKILFTKPELLPMWIEKNIGYHAVVLDYKAPYLLIRSNLPFKGKSNAIVYFGTSESIVMSKKPSNAMALLVPVNMTDFLGVMEMKKVKGQIPENIVGSKVRLLYSKSGKKRTKSNK